MRALIFDGTSPSLTDSHPAPTPGPGEALIRTTRAGVSRTDRAICRGLLDFTGVLGHEFVGVVESVAGDDPRQLKGRRVVGHVSAFCGRCGAPVPLVDPAEPTLEIPTGTLDGDPGTRPIQHIYTAGAAPWWDVDDGLPRHATHAGASRIRLQLPTPGQAGGRSSS